MQWARVNVLQVTSITVDFGVIAMSCTSNTNLHSSASYYIHMKNVRSRVQNASTGGRSNQCGKFYSVHTTPRYSILINAHHTTHRVSFVFGPSPLTQPLGVYVYSTKPLVYLINDVIPEILSSQHEHCVEHFSGLFNECLPSSVVVMLPSKT